MDRILIGVATRTSSARSARAVSLIDVFEKHLRSLAALDVLDELYFLQTVYFLEDSDVLKALFSSQSLWTTLSDLLRRLYAINRTDSKAKRGFLFSRVINFAQATLFAADKQSPRDALALLTIWIKSGLLDAVDDTMEGLVEEEGMTSQLTHLFKDILRLVPQADPAMSTLFVAQFPLSHSLSVLCRRDALYQSAAGPEEYMAASKLSSSGQPIPDDNPYWNQLCWQIVASVQYTARSPDLCEKRGCSNHGDKKCSKCKQVGYCSNKCQKQDWKDHKFICGFPGLQETRDRAEAIKDVVVTATASRP